MLKSIKGSKIVVLSGQFVLFEVARNHKRLKKKVLVTRLYLFKINKKTPS